MNSFLPYTYLVKWTKNDKWYYGSRYAKSCHPDDLWIDYFTSSKEVQKLREELGEPDVVQVRKTFHSAEEAVAWETKVLARMKVSILDNCLNQRENRWPLRPDYSHSEETKRKISEAKLGGKRGPHSAEHKHKLSIAAQNRSEEYRQKQRQAKLGKRWATNGKASKLVTDLPDNNWWWGRK